MIIRIVSGIRDHFEARFSEWLMGGTMTWYGLLLAGPGEGWPNPDTWQGMLQYASEDLWGWLCIAMGIARLAALVVNGTFAHTSYSRYSPHVRGIAAVLGSTFWFMVFMSVSAVSSSESGIYQLPLVLDLWCVFHAWRDTGRVEAARYGTPKSAP